MAERANRILLAISDPVVRGQAKTVLPPSLQVIGAADPDSAALQDVDAIVADASSGDRWLAATAEQDDAPPVILLDGQATEGSPGSSAPENSVFAHVSSPADLAILLPAALRFRRLQLENQLIRKESERVHSELLQNYGAIAEHSQKLEEEVKRRTIELRRYADQLEQQVEDRTEALQRSNSQLVQQEKMAALGALVSGIAHDMHTPIGTITSNSDVLGRSLARFREILKAETTPEEFRNSPDLKRVLGAMEETSRVNQLACDRIVGIVRSLRNFARLDEADVKTADLHEGIESTLTLVHHELKNRIVVKREFGKIPPVRCHPNQLNQVFMNLLVNASHAIADKGTITIRTFQEAEIVKVQIADSGSGIKPENLARIFETGFTTKQAGVGTGLGLAICKKIIDDHHGSIEVQSTPGEGTTFTIGLPLEWKTP